MALKKCNFKSHNDNDCSAPCFEIGPDVEFKEIPTTGEEYLLKVIKEREKCSIISDSNADYSKFAKNQSRFVKEDVPAKAPDRLKPTLEWQNIQVADFSDVRMYISRMRSNESLRPSNFKTANVAHFSAADWKNFFNIEEPTLSCMLGLQNIAELDSGLEHLVEMLDTIKPGQTIDYKTGQWIYAFLACVKQPVHSDTFSIIRRLGRKCAEIRSHLNADDDNALAASAPLNIFICLISRYFLQTDLGD